MTMKKEIVKSYIKTTGTVKNKQQQKSHCRISKSPLHR